MPFLAFIFGFGMFASIGLPGFANFASELMVFFGAFHYQAGMLSSDLMAVYRTSGARVTSLSGLDYHQIATICALWGVVVSAVYMLRAYRKIFLGAARQGEMVRAGVSETPTTDLRGGARWALGLLVVGLVVVGFRPQIMVNLLKPSLTLPGPSVEATTGLVPGVERMPVAIQAVRG